MRGSREELDGLRKQFSDVHTRFDNLWALADITQQVYLNLPSRFDEMKKRSEIHEPAAKPMDDEGIASA